MWLPYRTIYIGSIHGPVAHCSGPIRSGPRCWNHRARAGFRSQSTKAMIANLAGGNQTPARRSASNTSNRESHFRRTVQFHFARPDSAFYKPVHQRNVMSTKKKRIVEIESRQDRWRFTCPVCHCSWEPTNHHFWCQKCACRPDVDGVFYGLRDRKTGELVDRKRVRLVTPVGPYDQDLNREADDE